MYNNTEKEARKVNILTELPYLEILNEELDCAKEIKKQVEVDIHRNTKAVDKIHLTEALTASPPPVSATVTTF